MEDNKDNSFTVQISRELGSIDARLHNIEETLHGGKVSSDKMWEKIDENRRAINELYVKVAGISAGVAVIISGIPFLIRILDI
jgi:hypothetical protein